MNQHWPPKDSPAYCAAKVNTIDDAVRYRHGVDYKERNLPLPWRCSYCGKAVMANPGPEGGFAVTDYLIQEVPW